MFQIGITVEITTITNFDSFHSPATMSFDHVTKKISPRICTETHEGTFSTSLAFLIRREVNQWFQTPFVFLQMVYDIKIKTEL